MTPLQKFENQVAQGIESMKCRPGLHRGKLDFIASETRLSNVTVENIRIDGDVMTVRVHAKLMTAAQNVHTTLHVPGRYASISGSPLAPPGYRLISIVAGHHMHVAVTDDGKIASSPDAATWTTRLNLDLNKLAGYQAYHLNPGFRVFNRLDSTADTWESPDGTTWTKRTSPITFHPIIKASDFLSVNFHAKPKPDGCPKCGHAGNFVRMALTCPEHGMFGGM